MTAAGSQSSAASEVCSDGSASMITRYWLDCVIDRGNDTLAKQVVQRVVDGGGGDAEARRGLAIDDQVRGQALLLQVRSRH